ncbi:MAG: antibiotic biosynthesis monooxygenase [Candidatus Accumulibacter sp.]|uniref:putative quinol monooxygenase n=1 Tax=Accumulibacter sp. TaxID=2053492 RepID=UPI0019F7DF31|nr:putative quinol monooxygenase [Accumulibacter sp.]MBE2259949.1 antibiotic biosynthesis monooxygenase [Paracoccaceae bacterium]MCP5248282.1 antibiotic biosynthesis monooxygenase [Accumulibacter sp.]
MYVIAVDLTIHPQHLPAFMPLLLENARLSREREAACRRFDVCQDPLQPEHVFLYELYDDRAAFDAHLASAHFKAFDTAAQGMPASKTVHAYQLIGA